MLNMKSSAAVCVFVCFASVAAAEEAARAADPEIEALKARVAQLESRANESWLDEQRAEQIKALVREVIADADMRSSLAEGGVTAGYDDGFFIASEDGNFLLRFAGRVQFRYEAAFADDASDTDGGMLVEADENESGFAMRRTKLEFFGHIYSPRLEYKIVGAFDRAEGDFLLEESYVSYQLSDHYYVQAGGYKGPFLREELVSSKRQLAAERTNTNEFFTLDYNQNLEVGGVYDQFRWRASLHDGREGDNIDFDDDNTDIAAAGRAEYMVAGNWKQWDDFVAWSDTPVGVLLGAAVDYENGEGGDASGINWEHMLQYTADVSLEMQPWSFFAAYIGRLMEHDPGAAGVVGDDDLHQWGVIVQASVFVVPDKWDIFARWEYLNFDHAAEISAESGRQTVRPLLLASGVDDEQQIYTLGTNWYVHKHDTKVTFDLLWAPDGIRQGESGGGNITSNLGEDDQFVIRSQLQLLF